MKRYRKKKHKHSKFQIAHDFKHEHAFNTHERVSLSSINDRIEEFRQFFHNLLFRSLLLYESRTSINFIQKRDSLNAIIFPSNIEFWNKFKMEILFNIGKCTRKLNEN